MIGDDTLASGSVDREHDDEPSTTIAPPTDELHECLADVTRRRVLHRLLDTQSTSAEELADYLAGKAAAEDRDSVGPKEWERIQTRLHHVHLPRLDDVRLVSYDRDDESVELQPLAEPVREMIRFSVEYERDVASEQS